MIINFNFNVTIVFNYKHFFLLHCYIDVDISCVLELYIININLI